MSKYTAADRLIAALKGQYADRVPATVMFGTYAAVLGGVTTPEFFTSVEKNVKSHVAAYEMFRPDSLTVSGDIYLDAEAFGARVEFPENSTPDLKTSVLEDKSGLTKLRIPDPKKVDRLGWYLEVLQRARAQIKDCPVAAACSGPWTLAAELRGLEKIILDTKSDPGFVHQLMKLATEWLKVWLAEVRNTGAGVGVGEAAASCSVISPKIYRTFVKPYHQEIFSYFKERKLYVSLHICGYVDPMMEDILDTGVGMLSIDSPSSLGKLVELSRGRTVIVGNVPTSLFAEGSKSEMEAAVKQCTDTAATGSRYILCSGCEVPLTSRQENIGWFMEAARKYGSYEPAGVAQKPAAA